MVSNSSLQYSNISVMLFYGKDSLHCLILSSCHSFPHTMWHHNISSSVPRLSNVVCETKHEILWECLAPIDLGVYPLSDVGLEGIFRVV